MDFGCFYLPECGVPYNAPQPLSTSWNRQVCVSVPSLVYVPHDYDSSSDVTIICVSIVHQVLSTRARKDVAVADIKVQVFVFAFDCLYLNGQPLLPKPLTERRQALYDSLQPVEGQLQFATAKTSRDVDELEVGWLLAYCCSCSCSLVLATASCARFLCKAVVTHGTSVYVNSIMAAPCSIVCYTIAAEVNCLLLDKAVANMCHVLFHVGVPE